MVRHLICLTLVAGCGGVAENTPVAQPAQQPTFVQRPSDSAGIRPPPPPPAATVDAEEPGPRYPTWVPCPQCEERRERLAKAKSELEAEEAKTDAYVKAHCKGTLKRATHVYPGGARVSSGPEQAWICNGRLVDVPETLDEQILVARVGDLNHWIKLNCKDPGQPPAVGEKRCQEP